MIDYERFLKSFDIVDLEDDDSTGAVMRSRAAPPRPLTGGTGSVNAGGATQSPRRSRRAPPEGTPGRAVRSERLRPLHKYCTNAGPPALAYSFVAANDSVQPGYVGPIAPSEKDL